jgi:hypothetical protein
MLYDADPLIFFPDLASVTVDLLDIQRPEEDEV